jgi:hypothetical protein
VTSARVKADGTKIFKYYYITIHIGDKNMHIYIESTHPTLNTVNGIGFNALGKNGVMYCYKSMYGYHFNMANKLKEQLKNHVDVHNITAE